MSRAYGRERHNHRKRGGNNDSDFAWIFKNWSRKNPRLLGGFLILLLGLSR